MTNLIRDLRQHVCPPAEAKLMKAAANEIERMRAEIQKLIDKGPPRPDEVCQHGCFDDEICDGCYDEALERILLNGD